jgi:hypothetical protein
MSGVYVSPTPGKTYTPPGTIPPRRAPGVTSGNTSAGIDPATDRGLTDNPFTGA